MQYQPSLIEISSTPTIMQFHLFSEKNELLSSHYFDGKLNLLCYVKNRTISNHSFVSLSLLPTMRDV
jgi:hypothetical protein